MHYVEEGSGPPVVLCHGFPETWYSWRYQIPTLAKAGFRVIAPDMRGYGETDSPAELESYDMGHLVGDLTGLLDALGLEKAVLVGHDLGSNVVWMTAVMHPERVERIANLSGVYRGRPGQGPIKALKEQSDQRSAYVVYFQMPNLAETFFNSDLKMNLRRLYQFCAADSNFLAETDLDVFVEAFKKSGLTGPINWYRNIDRNWETTKELAGKPVSCPAIVITSDSGRTPMWPEAPWTPAGYKPLTSRPNLSQEAEQLVPNLRGRHVISNCGHWIQQEKPAEVNALLLDFLADLTSPRASGVKVS